jgi:hypothetical protein
MKDVSERQRKRQRIRDQLYEHMETMGMSRADIEQQKMDDERRDRAQDEGRKVVSEPQSELLPPEIVAINQRWEANEYLVGQHPVDVCIDDLTVDFKTLLDYALRNTRAVSTGAREQSQFDIWDRAVATYQIAARDFAHQYEGLSLTGDAKTNPSKVLDECELFVITRMAREAGKSIRQSQLSKETAHRDT